jgi:hypothetical protein
VLLLLALPEKLRKRKAQREDLRRYRDAMADDLMMRVFTDKLDLQDNGLELFARRFATYF